MGQKDEPGFLKIVFSLEQGDSGGPLMIRAGINNLSGGDRWTLIGTTSGGKKCAGKGSPPTFAHVSLYYDWIRKTIKENM